MSQEKTIRTAVVLVNYFGADDTEACIASLIGSDTSVTIVVVDNSPNDPRLKPALARFSEITILNPNENLGFARGNNVGFDWVLSNTECEFVFVFNNDATADPDVVSKLEKSMDVHDDVGIVAPRIVLSEDPKRLWYGGGEVDWRRGGARVYGFMGASDAPLAMTERYVGFASGCAMFMRREIIEATKGFDPRYFMYEEDMELSIRVMKMGWRILYVPDALVHHLGQGSLRRDRPFTGKWDHRNESFSFHAYHLARNSVVLALTHAKGIDACKFIFLYPVFLFAKLAPHLLRLKFRSISPVAIGLRDGLRVGRTRRESYTEAGSEGR